MNSYDECRELVNDLLPYAQNAKGDELNDWEKGFIKNLATWIEANRPLSDKQTSKLNSIWSKVFDAEEEDEREFTDD